MGLTSSAESKDELWKDENAHKILNNKIVKGVNFKTWR